MPTTIIRAIRETIEDAGLKPEDIQYINAHGTSTPKGDSTEVKCLREVFGKKIEKIPVSSNKSQLGHTLGATAAIEAALTIEGMKKGHYPAHDQSYSRSGILPILMLCPMMPANKNMKLLFPTLLVLAEQIAVLFSEECKNEAQTF